MAITPRVKRPPAPESVVDAVIGRGLAQPAPGSVSDPVKSFTLRAPASVLDRIAAAAAERPGRVSTNTWVLEAIEERFRRDTEKTS